MLFLFKLHALLEGDERGPTLQRCSLCSRLFAPALNSSKVCPKAPMSIDFNGNVVTEHVVDPDWDINSYLAELRKIGLSWKDIYWRNWALVTECYCCICQQYFPVAHLSHCVYHPINLVPRRGSQQGSIYPCCDEEPPPFGSHPAARISGCRERYHAIRYAVSGMFQGVLLVCKIFLFFCKNASTFNRRR